MNYNKQDARIVELFNKRHFSIMNIISLTKCLQDCMLRTQYRVNLASDFDRRPYFLLQFFGLLAFRFI